MISVKLIVLIHFFVICSYVTINEALKCYNCSTRDTWDCGYKFVPTKVGTIECLDGISCLKMKPPVIGGEYDIIERGCHKQELCTNLSVCFTCNKDLCNSSVKILPSFVILLIIIISVYVQMQYL